MASDSRTPPVATAVRCVLLDDDARTRQLATAALGQAGFVVECAANGDEALALLERECSVALVADERFLRKDDSQLRRRVHRDYPLLSIVVLSAAPSLESAVAAVADRAVAYLVKPLDTEQLVQSVRDAAERLQLQRQFQTIQQRLEGWGSELHDLQELLGPAEAAASRATLQGYFALTMRQVTASLADLYRLCHAAALVGGEDQAEEATTRYELTTAQTMLRETIAVLEQTKSSFRSKQLGRLRHRLEDVLQRIDSRSEPERPA